MARSMVEDGVRTVRLVAFSAGATVLSLGAHVLAGGPPPALAVILPAIAVTAVAAMALSRRRRRFIEITVVIGAVQLVLHEIFVSAVVTGSGEPVPVGHEGHVGQMGGPWMPVTHLVAVLVIAAVLAYGERAFHLMQGWWRAVPALCRALPPVTVPPSGNRVPVTARLRPLPTSRWICDPLVRRGPPVPAC